MKFRGTDIWAFWQAWPVGNNWFHEDYETEIEGDSGCLLDPNTRYDGGSLGVLCWQHSPQGDVETLRIGTKTLRRSLDYSFEEVLKAWLKTQTTTSFVIEVPNDQSKAFKTLMTEKGWKVLK